MKTFFIWAGYILGGLVVLVAFFFGALYVRYTSQSSEIHRVAEGFISQLRTGTSEGIQPYIYPDQHFIEQVAAMQKAKKEAFSHITKVTEKGSYFNYSWKLGTGETTEYDGTFTIDTGDTAEVSVDLIKHEGVWKVYHFLIN